MSDTPKRYLQSFEGIAPQSWEHPADRAALQALRALPGFDQVVKRVMGAFGETGIRVAFQANAVRVGPRQYKTLDRLMEDVKGVMDHRQDVPLFVSQRPWFNAGAYGVEHPFIVLNSATVDLLEPDELRVVLGHELGHVMSGHALYRTMLALILAFGVRNLPFLTGVALLPIRLALQEWSRKSELSSDHAALLACGNLEHALRMFMKAAGGTITGADQLDLEAYREQVNDYQQRGGFETLFKIINLLDQTHPFNTLRAAELLRWSESSEYRAILAGDYRRRGEQQGGEQFGADMSEAATYYATEAKEKAREVSAVARTVAEQAAVQAKDAVSKATDAARVRLEGVALRVGDAIRRRRQ